ncbi:MAG: hypothetical protein ABIK09_13005 [Pseudomonadota bacterium]
MGCRLVLALFWLLGSAGGGVAAEVSKHDPLWEKALAVAAKNRTWRPRRVLEDEKLLDQKGKPARRTESVHEIFRDDQGRYQGRLVRATRGGEDVTEARRVELSKRPQREFFKPENDVFSPQWNAAHTATRTDLHHDFDGRSHVGFQYTMEARDATWVGVVFLDEETGVPRLITVVPDRFPVNENVKIRNMTMELHFKEAGARWFLERMEISTNIEAKISVFYTWKGRSEVTLTFEDWHEVEEFSARCDSRSRSGGAPPSSR